MDLIRKSTSKEQYLNLSPFTGFSRSFNILYLTHIYTTRTWSSIKINQLQAYNCIFFLAVQPFIISVAASNPSLKEIYGLDRRMNFHRSCDSGESWRQITDGYFNKTLTESQLIKAKALSENLVSEMPTSDLTALADSTGTTWGGEWFEKKFYITDARRASHYLLCCVGEGVVWGRSHGFQMEWKRDQSSPTEFKGGLEQIDCQLNASEVGSGDTTQSSNPSDDK